MSIDVLSTLWGFQIKIKTSDQEALHSVVEALKILIPKRTRRYHESTRHWFIDKRSEKRLRQWLEVVKNKIADVQISERQQNEIAA